MATSGTFITYLSGDFYMKMNWQLVSQDIANNSSVVNVDLIIGASYSVSASGTRDAQITINGSSRPFSFSINSSSGAWSQTLGSHYVTVPHNATGDASPAISAWADIKLTWSGNYIGRGSISGGMTLPRIPRASSFTLIPTSKEAGSSWSAPIDRASTSFTHDVKFTFGSNTQTLTGQTTSVAFTIPLAWLNAIPNSTSGTMSIVLTTKNGSTVIGTKTYSSTVTAPSTVVPTFASLGLTRVDGPVPAAWAAYVQNKSKATLTINSPAGIYGSTIKSYKIVGAGATKTTQTATFDLPTSGNITFTATVTDSRNRTFSRSVSITVLAYTPPTLAKVEIDRALSTGVPNTDGTYVRVLVDDVVDSVSGKNTPISRTIDYKTTAASTWTAAGSYSDNTAAVIGGGAISIDNDYNVRVTLTDAFTTVVSTVTVTSSFVLIDFLSDGKGIAFGKASSKSNVFESAMPILPAAGFQYISLASGDDLNNYKTPITCFISSNAISAAIANTPPSNYAGTLEVIPGVSNTTGCIQFFHEYNVGTSGNTWRRRLYGGVWSAWVLYAGDGVFTYGNNANGYWRRNNVNGLQECWINTTVNQAINTAYGSLFQGTYRWTFPKEFVNLNSVYPLPTVTCSQFLWGTGASWGAVVGSASTYSDLRGIDAFSRAAGSTSISAYAIGYTTS